MATGSKKVTKKTPPAKKFTAKAASAAAAKPAPAKKAAEKPKPIKAKETAEVRDLKAQLAVAQAARTSLYSYLSAIRIPLLTVTVLVIAKRNSDRKKRKSPQRLPREDVPAFTGIAHTDVALMRVAHIGDSRKAFTVQRRVQSIVTPLQSN
ncbi:hypothetical protein R3P38DRAFT_2812390 [Favolaschia claudopus]|uniref:Uncharacterized protein n=1 Tax=Favolaschia claudopus TaxID=2862362 RepID=A0AAV9Z799_9AGAR